MQSRGFVDSMVGEMLVAEPGIQLDSVIKSEMLVKIRRRFT